MMEGGIGKSSVDSFFLWFFFLGRVQLPQVSKRLRPQEQRLSSLSQTNNSKGVSQSNIDRKEKGKREEDEEKKKESGGGEEKRKENKGKKNLGEWAGS